MGCHGEFQLGRESDCQDIVEISKQIYNQSSFLEIKTNKTIILIAEKQSLQSEILVLLLLLLLLLLLFLLILLLLL